jgi:uncharacterized Zn finger protein (UPF0148 family)
MSNMSDFDKEKEREKLREKYERDQEKREATEEMSELLLKGATMTNAHCSNCGDPIFRYDGQEFCATCQQPVEREQPDEDEETDGAAGNVEVTTPSDDATVVFGGDMPDEADQEQPADGQSHQTDRQAPNQPTTEPGQQPQPTNVPSLDPETAAGQQSQSAAGGAGSDVATARAALVTTLTRFSQQAQAAQDPQTAREHLKTAKVAAETLAALDN